MQNNLDEFYALLSFAVPGLLGTFSAFKCVYGEQGAMCCQALPETCARSRAPQHGTPCVYVARLVRMDLAASAGAVQATSLPGQGTRMHPRRTRSWGLSGQSEWPHRLP